MPSRIIRESALTSPSLAKLTAHAERLWWRLTIVADDHGRFDANPEVVRARCYPLLLLVYSVEDVQTQLAELVKSGGIKRYRVEGRMYGYFVNWERYQRAPRSVPKFPNPPQVAAIRRNPPQNSASCGVESLVVKREAVNEKREAGDGKRGSGGETQISNLFLSQREREQKEIQDRLKKRGRDH